jgi:hypothetical protein
MNEPHDEDPPDSVLKPMVELPDYLAKLPNLGFIGRPANSAAESQQPGVLINQTSLGKLIATGLEYFAKVRSSSK